MNIEKAFALGARMAEMINDAGLKPDERETVAMSVLGAAAFCAREAGWPKERFLSEAFELAAKVY